MQKDTGLAENSENDLEPSGKKFPKKQTRLVDLLQNNPFSPKIVGTNDRLQQPIKRIVFNLLRFGVSPSVIAAACGLSYSSVMYYKRKILGKRGYKK